MVFNLVDKAWFLSSEKYRKNNSELVNEVLLKNAYPENFIDKFIKELN